MVSQSKLLSYSFHFGVSMVGGDDVMDRHEEIRNSYKQLGGSYASFYDGMITYSSPFGKLLNKWIWGFNAETTAEWMNKALSGVPEDFSGKLLEIPVGTGVITMPMYSKLPDADITCMDYSEDMMNNAVRRSEAIGIHNITFRQGDVGNLPFDDESFDIVLSLNGFHAFPDKDAAYRETYRVLKKGGTFCGCFYVRGEMKKTDRFTDRVFVPKGAFTPPFETKESLRDRLEKMYEKVNVETVLAEGIFCCTK